MHELSWVKRSKLPSWTLLRSPMRMPSIASRRGGDVVAPPSRSIEIITPRSRRHRSRRLAPSASCASARCTHACQTGTEGIHAPREEPRCCPSSVRRWREAPRVSRRIPQAIGPGVRHLDGLGFRQALTPALRPAAAGDFRCSAGTSTRSGGIGAVMLSRVSAGNGSVNIGR